MGKSVMSLASVLVAVGLVHLAVQIDADPADGTIFMQHDCAGNFYMFPSAAGMGFAVGAESRFNLLFNATKNYIKSIATCHCPKLAEDGKDELLFGVGLEMLLRILQKDESGGFSRRDLENICGSGSVTSFNNPGDVDYLPVDLADQLGDNGEPLWKNPPSTCRASDYSTTGCFMELPVIPDLITVQIAAKQCAVDSGSKFPFFSVSLKGAFPEYLGRPCNANSQCGRRATCDDPIDLLELDDPQENLGSLIMSALKEASLFDSDSGQCKTNSGRMGIDMMNIMMKAYGEMAELNVNTESYRKICGLQLIKQTIDDTPVQFCTEGDKSWDCNPQTATHGKTIITYPNDILAWDGTLANGDNIKASIDAPHPRALSVMMANKVEPKCQASYNRGEVVPVMQHQCRVEGKEEVSGAYLLTPLSPMKFAAQTPALQNMLKRILLPAMNKLNDDCHGGNLPMWQFVLWQPGFWMHVFDGSATPSTAIVKSPFQLLHEQIGYNNIAATGFPSTCTKERWNSEGTCQMQIPSANEIFGFPSGSFTLRITFSKCSQDEDALPFFYMDCVGSKCSSIFEPEKIKSCESDRDCQDYPNEPSTSAKCSSWDQNKYKIDFDNSLYRGSGLLQYALWQGSPTDACGNHTGDLRELLDLAHVWSDRAPVTGNPTKWCETIFETYPDNIGDLLEDWANSMYTKSTTRFGLDTYNLRGLTEWQPVGANDGCKDGIDGGYGSNHVGFQKLNPGSISFKLKTTKAFSSLVTDKSNPEYTTFRADIISGLMDLTAFNDATGINARTVSLNDVFITETPTGVEINVYVDGEFDSVRQLANTLSEPQHRNALAAELKKSNINGASSVQLETISAEGPTLSPATEGDDGLSAAAIAGIACGAVAFLVIVGLLVFLVLRSAGGTSSGRNTQYESQVNGNPTFDGDNNMI